MASSNSNKKGMDKARMTTKTLKCSLRVERVLYPKTEFQPGGFAIVVCSPDNVTEGEPYNMDKIVVKGNWFSIDMGIVYKLIGKYGKDKYGESYTIESIEEDFSFNNIDDKLQYLSAVLTKPQYILLTKSLDDPFETLERKDYARLSSIKGIGPVKAQRMVDSFHNRIEQAKAFTKLGKYGLSMRMITSLLKKVHSADELIAMIEDNPYVMIDSVEGIGWARADAIAREKGITTDDPRRVEAYIKYFLQSRADQGHTWCYPQELWDSMSYELETDNQMLLKQGLLSLREKGEVWWDENNADKSKVRLALSRLRNLEIKIAHELHRIASGEPIKPSGDAALQIAEMEQQQGWTFTEEQRAAIYGTLNNNVSIITGAAGCVDGETEFFTGKGWKKIRDYSPDDSVMQYNYDGTTTLVIPEKYHKYPCNELLKVETESHSICQRISDDHTVVYETSKGNLATICGAELMRRQNENVKGFYGKFRTTFRYDGAGIPLTDAEIRLMCAVICDGSFIRNSTSNWCRINLKKKRKQERIVQLLEQWGGQYSVQSWNKKDPAYRNYCFYAPVRIKQFTPEWYNCSQHQLQVICDEILWWDGSFGRGGRMNFSTTIKATADFVQFAFSATGHRTTIRTTFRPNKKYLNEYTVLVSQHIDSLVGITGQGGSSKEKARPLITKVASSDGFKYCFTVPSHMWVMRYNNRICITGNCGKTSAVSGVLRLLHDHEFAQCALSGRAAARMQEVTGTQGSTIHRLLGYVPGQGFTYNRDNPLPQDIIILDEISMVGASIFYKLIQAIRTGAKLIMIGDGNQLEAIGLCNLFKDMLDSKVINVGLLTKIQRQAAKSAIVTESAKVRNHEQLCSPSWVGMETRGELKDFLLQVYSDSILTYDNIINHYKFLIESGVSKDDIQIVVPMRTRGDACVLNINNGIQAYINPHGKPAKFCDSVRVGYQLREGDRVICVRNSYDAKQPLKPGQDEPDTCPIYNGDRGVLTKVNYDASVTIRFDMWGDIVIPQGKLTDIELGYALSCHKLQGSEANYVIVGFDMASRILLTKEWLYTAITRAKKYCVVTCEKNALQFAIRTSNVPNKKTFLKELLQEEFSQPYTEGDEANSTEEEAFELDD